MNFPWRGKENSDYSKLQEGKEKSESHHRCSAESYESGRVVIFDRLGISEGFEDGVSLQQLLFQLPLVEMKRTATHDIKYSPIPP